MVKINRIPPQTVEVFDPNGNCIGTANEYEFNDLRIQILKERAKGYSIKYNGEMLEIDPWQGLWDFKVGLFDLLEKQYVDLIHFKKSKPV